MLRFLKNDARPSSGNEEKKPSLKNAALFQGTSEIAVKFVEHRINLTFTFTEIHLCIKLFQETCVARILLVLSK